MEKVIDYYFTASSPWTYLGHARLVALAARYRASINVRPVELGGRIFPVSGGLPVARRSKQRQAYRLVELNRWSRSLHIPLNLHPRYFPVDASPAARLIITVDMIHGVAAALEVSGGIMSALWADDRDIADPHTLESIAGVSDLDGQTLLKKSDGEDVRNRFQQYTEEAIARNVFGAPFYIYQNEPFWGQDRLEFLARALAGN